VSHSLISSSVGFAACIEGTLVNIAAGGGEKSAVEFGHPSGTLKVGAVIQKENGKFIVDKATMSRSARIIMEGHVHVPAGTMN
jgi:2-methylaconitate cis-trans-isomerase PrpF